MPELPEVEVVKEGLKKSITGLTISDTTVFNNRLRTTIPDNLLEKIKGKVIKGVLRRGKHGVILTNGNYHLNFHLGMTGNFKILENYKNNNKHDHFAIELNDNLHLVYNDIRKFGYISLLKKPLDLINFKNLGIEPNLIPLQKIKIIGIFKKKNRNIKNLLLDQSIITGIGNIYASEILYDAKIDPMRTGISIKKNEYEKILVSCVKVIKKAILKGGTTIKDYKNIEGKLGYFQTEFKVYDRKGLPCYKCKNLIKKIKQNGRSTYYCYKCQK